MYPHLLLRLDSTPYLLPGDSAVVISFVMSVFHTKQKTCYQKWASKITPSNGLSERNRDSRLDSFPKLTGMVPFK